MKTDEQILEEYLKLMELPHVEEPWRGFFLRVIARARQDEPRINCGLHVMDWENICDDDDDFDSFYGTDYFTKHPG